MLINDNKLQSAYDLGYTDMQLNIIEIGFKAALAMFNYTYPPGRPYDGSREGYYYMKGEFAALFKETDSGKLTVEQTQERFGGTLTDHQAVVYTELHNCE
jgi:hypothetical protein